MSRACVCCQYCSNIFINNITGIFALQNMRNRHKILRSKLISYLMYSTKKLQACNLLENFIFSTNCAYFMIIEAYIIRFSRFISKTKR